MATAEQLNDLRDQAAINNRQNPYPAYPSDSGGRDPFEGDMASHGNPDPTIRIRRYFEEGDIEQGLAMLGSILNLKGAAASDGAQGLIDTFGIPLTVAELRETQGLDVDGNEIGDVPSGEDITNETSEPFYGLNRAGDPLSEADFNWILNNGGEDTNDNGIIDPDELTAWRASLDSATNGEPSNGDDQNNNSNENLDNGNNEPADPIDNRVIPSDLANQDVLGQLLGDFNNGELTLDATGILGAVFGANLADAMLDDNLIAQVLGLFDLGPDKNSNDNDNENGQLPDSGDINNNPPNGNENQFPPNNENGNGENPPNNGGNPTNNDNDSDRRDDDGDSGMDEFERLLLDGLLELLGVDRRDMPGGGTGVAVAQGGDSESRADSTATSESSAQSGDVSSDIQIGDTEGGDARAEGGSADVNIGDSGSSADTTIGDFLSNVTTNFMPQAADVVGAAAQDYLTQKYAVDAQEKAQEKELEFLRELMARQDTFQLFRNLGLPITDAEGNIIEDNTRADFQINQLRDLVNQQLGDEYQIQPEVDILPLIQEVTPIDPSGLNQINVADLLANYDVGLSPDARQTIVNQIDPFNPEDPALRFLQDEGRRAIESSAAAQGRLNSGGTLQELQNQAIGTAAQYAGDLADIGRVQDTSQLAADQQFYSQLLGQGQDDYTRNLNLLGTLSDVQAGQDDMFLEGDLARFNSQQKDIGQRFDQSVLANTDAQNRNAQLFNQMTPLIDMGLAGAEGLTGNISTFSDQGSPIYKELGRISGGEQLNKRMRNMDLANSGYNILKKTLGF